MRREGLTAYIECARVPELDVISENDEKKNSPASTLTVHPWDTSTITEIEVRDGVELNLGVRLSALCPDLTLQVGRSSALILTEPGQELAVCRLSINAEDHSLCNMRLATVKTADISAQGDAVISQLYVGGHLFTNRCTPDQLVDVELCDVKAIVTPKEARHTHTRVKSNHFFENMQIVLNPFFLIKLSICTVFVCGCDVRSD
jgi:hypothetical protein